MRDNRGSEPKRARLGLIMKHSIAPLAGAGAGAGASTSSRGRRACLHAAAAGALAGAAPLAQAQAGREANPLRVGVVPNVSARVVARNYQPWTRYMERALGMEVAVHTAGNFAEFHAKAVAGEYDVIITAADLGRLAEVDSGWVLQALYEPPIPGTIVRLKGQTGSAVAALKGRGLAMANPQSLVVLRGMEWLASQGLKAGVDYQLVQVRNDDSLPALLTGGATPRAMMSMGEFRSVPEAARAQLEVETIFAEVPGFTVLTSPKLAPATATRVREALLGLPASEEGKQFAELSGVRGVRAARPRELESLDSMLAATRAGLAR